MSLLRSLQCVYRTRLPGAGRAAAAALLLVASLAAPGAAPILAAPILAAPAAVAPLAPQDCPIDVWNDLDNLTAHTLREAVACATDGQTVTFQSGGAGQTISLLHGEIPITQSITIDGSNAPGIIVDAGNTSRVFAISASGPVTLTALTLQNGQTPGSGGAVAASNSVVLNQVQVLSSTAPSGSGGGLFAGGTATLIDTDFISNTSGGHGGGAWVTVDAVVTNGRFERNSCTVSGCQGGGLNVNGLTLTGTVFISNTSDDQGGGVWANSAAALTNGLLQGNRCTDSNCTGGGLYANTSLTLTGTNFISNQSINHGGGAYATGAALLTNGSFQGNQCTDTLCAGGGLFANATLTLSGTDFISNTSYLSGGGAWANSAALLTNGSFQGNRCTVGTCQGGGLYANTTLADTNTPFIGNSSTGNGGGAYAASAALVAHAHFYGNQCTDSPCEGGGLYASTTLAAMMGTNFISNSSVTNGGGASVQGVMTATSSLFQENQCTDASGCVGGGLSADALTLSGSSFFSNTSTSDGGGAFVVNAATLAGGIFQGNLCHLVDCKGGGLRADTLVLTGTQFTGNRAGDPAGGEGSGSGGGAYTLGAAALAGGLFQDNGCGATYCHGGGLYASSLTLTGTRFIGNHSFNNGGGAYVAGAAELTGGLFQDNHCIWQLGACNGGGLFAASSLSLTATDFISNSSTRIGGGAYVVGAASLAGGLFQGNICTISTCEAGGLMVTGSLTLSGTEFIGNSSGIGGGGAVVAAGGGALVNGLFQENQCIDRYGGQNCQGGGLLASGTVLVTGSTFSGNGSSGVGGGLVITDAGQLTLANDTFSGNQAQAAGGGMFVGGGSSAKLYNVTVADNQAPNGGGLGAEPGATVGVSNTLFSNNTTNNCSGPISFGTHNLEFPGANCHAAGPSAGFTTANPLLAPLALNLPGTTLTRALLPNSPARDHGDPATCAAAPVNNRDQRGAVRPDAVGEACDIGAYEAGPPDWLVFLPLVRK